jgi:hypothetical protein
MQELNIMAQGLSFREWHRLIQVFFFIRISDSSILLIMTMIKQLILLRCLLLVTRYLWTFILFMRLFSLLKLLLIRLLLNLVFLYLLTHLLLVFIYIWLKLWNGRIRVICSFLYDLRNICLFNLLYLLLKKWA